VRTFRGPGNVLGAAVRPVALGVFARLVVGAGDVDRVPAAALGGRKVLESDGAGVGGAAATLTARPLLHAGAPTLNSRSSTPHPSRPRLQEVGLSLRSGVRGRPN